MIQIILIIIGVAIGVILLTKKTREQILRQAQAETQNDFIALEQSILSEAFTAKQHSNILQNVGML